MEPTNVYKKVKLKYILGLILEKYAPAICYTDQLHEIRIKAAL